jgi:hypothetical protein
MPATVAVAAAVSPHLPRSVHVAAAALAAGATPSARKLHPLDFYTPVRR